MTGPAHPQGTETFEEYAARYRHGAAKVPAPWDCDCGVAQHSAYVDQCPTCGRRRPYAYEAPLLTTADDAEIKHAPGELPGSWPRPDESPETYAARVRTNGAGVLDGTDAHTTVDVEPVAPLALGAPPPEAGKGPGHYAPVTLRQGRLSIALDLAVFQLIVDTANKAAVHGAVRSCVVAIDSPTRATLHLVADFDRTGDVVPHRVADE